MSVFVTVLNTAVIVFLNAALCANEMPASVYLDYLNLCV
jgi:hypothetical protein